MEQRIRPVDVIAVCSASGEIRPLRVRLEDDSHELLRIDIDEVVSVRDIPYVGVEAHVFLCRGAVGEREWIFELKYTIRSHTWFLLRRMR